MSFDQLAPHYRWLEWLLAGRVLQRARLAHLPALDGARRVLLAGEGPGQFLAAFRARRPDADITVVDCSAAMLRIAARGVLDPLRNSASSRAGNAGPGGTLAAPAAGNVEFIRADLRTWTPPPDAFDAIVTACVLDCFSPDTLPAVIARLARAAAAEADWLQVDFVVPPQGWRRARARMVHALMYATFRTVTDIEARRVTPPDRWLRSVGFRRIRSKTFSAGLIRSDHWKRTQFQD